MRWIYKILCAVALVCFSAPFATIAADDLDAPTAQEQLAALKDDIATPAIPSKQKVAIREYMLNQARRLKNAGYRVETMRKGEVIVVTLQTDKMFAPNDTVLFQSVEGRLKRFLPYLKTPGMYKVILAAHSDDTGSEVYRQQLTEARVLALYDYFDRQGVDLTSVVGYAIGSIKPLRPNDSRQGRATNRRIEVYIVPDQGLINLARDRRL